MDGIKRLEALFRTLADGNRLKLIGIIADKTCSVTELVEATGLTQPLVSHHLRVLRDNDVLERERRGAFVYHKLKDIRMLDALGAFSEIAESITKTEQEERAFCCPPWFGKTSMMKRRNVWEPKKK
jgi:DNA-binding transcriptional ArsR family regulator